MRGEWNQVRSRRTYSVSFAAEAAYQVAAENILLRNRVY